MKKITKLLVFISILLILIAPVFSFAQSISPSLGLVPCNNTPDASGVIAQKCDFDAFMNLINKVIKFVLFDLAVPIAAIMFLYAGFELITSGGSTEKRGMAKKVFTNALIGLALAAAAWLIVRTILSILGYDGAWIGF
jgi:hypothetical protein